MSGATAKNAAKNIALVVLILLLGVLCAATWLTGLNIAEMPADNPLRRAYDQLFGGAVGYELRSSGIAAAAPSQIAITRDGTLYAVQYSPSEIDAALQNIGPVFGEALSGASAFRPAEEAELLAALEGECALLHYHGMIPVSVVAGWVGGANESRLLAGSFLLSADSSKLYLRADEGALYAADVKLSSDAFFRAQSAFRGLVGSFAGADYPVWPETLLLEREVLSFDVLRPVPMRLLDPQSDASLQTLLGAFQYTPYARSYPEQGGATQVFVSDTSTLRIAEDGGLQYTSTGSGGAVQAYDQGEAEGAAALGAQLDCARGVLDEVMRAVEAQTSASLYTVLEQEDTTTLVFLQSYGGVPVLGDRDFATFVFRGGVLISASVNLQQFTTDDPPQKRIVLPARQAAASADGTRPNLFAAYRRQGETYIPERVFSE